MTKKSPVLSTLLSHGEQCRVLGEKARFLRKQRGMSRRELAAASGVSSATIARFETTGVTTTPVLLKLAVAMDALPSLAAVFETESFATLEEFERG